MYDDLNTNNRVYLIFCDISNYRHWVNESLKPDKFFTNLDKLKLALKELCEIEYPYDSPAPAEQLEELIDNEQKIIQDFLARAWISVVSEAKKLKTDKGRQNKISKYLDSLSDYKNRFSEDTLKMLEDAKSSEPDFNLSKVTKAEKDLLFLNKTEEVLTVQNKIIDDLPDSDSNYSWLYNNRLLYYRIIDNDLPDDVFIDIIKLILSSYDYKKAARFIRIKYNFETRYAIEIYLTANTMLHSKARISELSRSFDFYSIGVHDSPCPICKKKAGKIYSFSDAVIGETYPPFCRHNCSNALPFNK